MFFFTSEVWNICDTINQAIDLYTASHGFVALDDGASRFKICKLAVLILFFGENSTLNLLTTYTDSIVFSMWESFKCYKHACRIDKLQNFSTLFVSAPLFNVLTAVDLIVADYLHPHIYNNKKTIGNFWSPFNEVLLGSYRDLRTYKKMNYILNNCLLTINELRYFEMSAAPYGYLHACLDKAIGYISSVQLTTYKREKFVGDEAVLKRLPSSTCYTNQVTDLDVDSKDFFNDLLDEMVVRPFNFLSWDFSIGINKNKKQHDTAHHYVSVRSTSKYRKNTFIEDYDDIPFVNLSRHDYRLYNFCSLIRSYMMLGGHAVFKSFQNFTLASFYLLRTLRTLFFTVTIMKNPHSKAIGFEYYIICSNYRGGNDINVDSNLGSFIKLNDALVHHKAFVLTSVAMTNFDNYLYPGVVACKSRTFNRYLDPF